MSASMGAGHDGAAAELARRLEARGASTRTVDFLEAAPRLGHLLRRCYELQLSNAPWSYEATYRIWFALPVLCRPLVWALSALFGRRLRKWAGDLGAGMVVSTYPLASVVLGHDRRAGRLRTPVATFLTDFAIHPLWVHPDVDLHLCVHPRTADSVKARCPRSRVEAPGPLVKDAFERASRDRRALGIPADATVVLIVAGSWGVGELEQTFAEVCASGRFLPVVVCGNNDRLRERLAARRSEGIILGWTDRMPELMGAADVLLQNGGGLTCMEAFAAGLPVVSYRPIPGHGRENALEMHRAGVAEYAESSSSLVPALERASTLAGRRSVGRAREMFRADASEAVAALPGAVSGVRARHGGARRRAAALALTGACALAGMNLLSVAATAAGVGVVHPSGPATYLAVRLGPSNIADPALATALAQAHATAIVEGGLALRHPADIARLSSAGVKLENGGWGTDSRFHVLAADDGVVRADDEIAKAAGTRCCSDFAPDQPVTGIDLASAHLEHERVVRPSVVVLPDGAGRGLRRGIVYVVDAERGSSSSVEAALWRLHVAEADHRVVVRPLSSLA